MDSADFVIFVFALVIALALAGLATVLNLVDPVYALLYGIVGSFVIAVGGVVLRHLFR